MTTQIDEPRMISENEKIAYIFARIDKTTPLNEFFDGGIQTLMLKGNNPPLKELRDKFKINLIKDFWKHFGGYNFEEFLKLSLSYILEKPGVGKRTIEKLFYNLCVYLLNETLIGQKYIEYLKKDESAIFVDSLP